MNYFSYGNENGSYSKAVSLKNVRSIVTDNGTGKSAIRYSVLIHYLDNSVEIFDNLTEGEMKRVYSALLIALNDNKGE